MRLIGSDLMCQRGGRQVFAGISFGLSGGEALVLTGRNGAGKSSLLRMIAGLVRVAGGQLTLEGGRVEITEQAQPETEPDARVSGPVSAWVSALGPGGSSSDLQFSGKRQLADAVLGGFTQAGARSAAAA